MNFKEYLEENKLPDPYLYLLGKINNFNIYIVDGESIRDKIDIDFVLGGNPGRYEFIPENEIWLDEFSSSRDIAPDLLHEYIEYFLIKNRSKSYDEAHEIANQYERILRKKEKRKLQHPIDEVEKELKNIKL